MRGKQPQIIMLMMVFLIAVIVSGCGNRNKGESTFGLEDFEAAMKDRGYVFEVMDADEDFLPAARKRMTIGEEVLDIYLFNSDKKMESEAGNIDEGGCGYNNGRTRKNVSWVSYPHFFKKGSIIVQYVGAIDSMKDTLRDIMGEQFAGYKGQE